MLKSLHTTNSKAASLNSKLWLCPWLVNIKQERIAQHRQQLEQRWRLSILLGFSFYLHKHHLGLVMVIHQFLDKNSSLYLSGTKLFRGCWFYAQAIKAVAMSLKVHRGWPFLLKLGGYCAIRLQTREFKIELI